MCRKARRPARNRRPSLLLQLVRGETRASSIELDLVGTHRAVVVHAALGGLGTLRAEECIVLAGGCRLPCRRGAAAPLCTLQAQADLPIVGIDAEDLDISSCSLG